MAILQKIPLKDGTVISGIMRVTKIKEYLVKLDFSYCGYIANIKLGLN